MEPLVTPQSFAAYRRLRDRNPLYTEPFVPCVGAKYGTANLPRFVFCGAAIWERELAAYECDDIDAFSRSLKFTEEFVAGVGEGLHRRSAFWRLFESASQLIFGAQCSLRDRTKASVWTNLSKIGETGQSQPTNVPDLMDLDVEQIRCELTRLEPDIILCVSGSMLVDTGKKAFSAFEKVGARLNSADSELRRLPNGGFLLWTMHPNRKTTNWRSALLGDLSNVMS